MHILSVIDRKLWYFYNQFNSCNKNFNFIHLKLNDQQLSKIGKHNKNINQSCSRILQVVNFPCTHRNTKCLLEVLARDPHTRSGTIYNCIPLRRTRPSHRAPAACSSTKLPLVSRSPLAWIYSF